MLKKERETAEKLRTIHKPLYFKEPDQKEHCRLLSILGGIHLERATLEKDNDLYLKAANLYKRTLLRSRIYSVYDEE